MGSSDFYGVFPYLVWPIDEAGEATTASEISGPIRTTRSMSAANHPLSEDERSRIRASIGKVTRVAATRLGEAGDAATAVAFIADLHRDIDQVVRVTQARGAALDCKALCAHCCSVRVEATAPEIFHIARTIGARPAADVAAVRRRLEEHHAVARDGTPPLRSPCAFLEDNLCSIYAVRPAVCRKAHSLSVARCEEFAPEIPQTLDLLIAAETLMQCTADAYRERGLDVSAQELCAAVLAALRDPDAEARWFRGEAVFADQRP